VPNRFTPLQTGSDSAQLVSIINKNFAELDNEGVKKLYSGSDGIPRIFIDGASGVIKVAPAGTDVTTATNSQLNFNSAQNIFKVVYKGTGTITHAANATVGTPIVYAHGLGYAPICVAYITDSVGGGNIPLPFIPIATTGADSGKVQASISVRTDSTNISIELLAPNWAANTYYTTAYSYQITYYILQETAT